MALHVELYALSNLKELAATDPVTTMARLVVIECMPLNARLTDVVARGKSSGWGSPVVTPLPCPRGFQLSETNHDDHTHVFNVDHYGVPLTWLFASEFSEVTLEGFEQDGQPIDFLAHHPDAVAALAYIKALPPDTPIVLYWI